MSRQAEFDVALQATAVFAWKALSEYLFFLLGTRDTAECSMQPTDATDKTAGSPRQAKQQCEVYGLEADTAVMLCGLRPPVF